ncbi:MULTISPECIES: hypothetical protein [Sphingomonas]|uniref:Uncharacterized protein n=1 Tax=Sphingomonas leidyi TaxID=68569 RepID=A0A7X5ZWP0_9SPHN|nr:MULTISPECIES: hypothetical protein [Sphingomonas]MBN8811131.1 hypothetical protein [Sphingomonas sp.]NIJ66435.1 hypothetical protein [Sphingomonas leidyi]
MATPAPTSTPTPSQPPVEILYAVPVGTVIFWYPPPTAFTTGSSGTGAAPVLTYPPGFMLCDGSTVHDPDSPFDGSNLPSLIDRFVLGAGTVPYGTAGGYGIDGWPNPSIDTQSTAASNSDAVRNDIIQGESPTSGYRYVLTSDDDKNDGNHHHNLAAGAFTVPLPPYMTLIPIMRIK